VSHLFLLGDGPEITRRRAKLAPGQIVEAWADLYIEGVFWVGETSKALLDGAGAPMPSELSIPAEAIAIYYGPRLCDLEALPPEESLRARVVSSHGIAVAWATLDRFGERTGYEPRSPADPTFHLRRMGGHAGHLWRLFQTRSEAVVWMAETYGKDSEGHDWAEALAVADFDDLLTRHARRD
jgi:hypothetical protein